MLIIVGRVVVFPQVQQWLPERQPGLALSVLLTHKGRDRGAVAVGRLDTGSCLRCLLLRLLTCLLSRPLLCLLLCLLLGLLCLRLLLLLLLRRLRS